MARQIDARAIVESVVLDMVTDHCIRHGIAPEDAGIFFSAASESRWAVLKMAEKHYVIGTDDPMEVLAADSLVGIETVSFRNAGADDDLIRLGTERAMMAVFLLTIQTMGEMERGENSRG